MRNLLLLLIFLTSPVFAFTPYCSCYTGDPADPYGRPTEINRLLNPDGAPHANYTYTWDCYWINSTGNMGDYHLCEAGCAANNVKFIDVSYYEGWTIATTGDCKVAAPPDVTPQDTGGDTGTINPPTPPTPPTPSDDPPPFPCGYPGAQYIDCNVYDAKVHTELKGIKASVDKVDTSVHGVTTAVGATTTAVNNTTTAVKEVTTAVKEVTAELKVQTGEIKAQTTAVKEATVEQKLQTAELKLQTPELKAINIATTHSDTTLTTLSNNFTKYQTDTKDQLTKLEDAALHKGLKLTIGSCVEAEKVYDKLPKLSGGVFSDQVLTGFNCTGDQVYCAQLELQAQSYCRDVISQRLESMYLNGGNVFVSCSPNYEGQLDAAGKPTCKYKSTGSCASPGYPNPTGLPDCNQPIVVPCPSVEFVPVIIAGGFSCDTKLAAGKFNAQISVFQSFIDAVRDKVGDQVLMAVKDPVVQSTEGFATDFNRLHNAFKSGKTDYGALGVNPGVIPEGASSAGQLFTDGPTIEFMGYHQTNPMVTFGRQAYNLAIVFIPNPLLVFASQGNCSELTSGFSSVEQSLMAIVLGGRSTGIFDKFSESLCGTYVPVVQYFLGFFLAFWTGLYVYHTLIQCMYIAFGGGASDFVLQSSPTPVASYSNDWG